MCDITLPGLSFFLTDDSLVTSYLQTDLLGIPIIRPADIKTIRPHPYELHANSGPTHDFYSILSNPFFLQYIINIKYLFASEFLSIGGGSDDGKSDACSPIHYMTTQDEWYA